MEKQTEKHSETDTEKIDRELYLNTAIEKIDNNEINAEETLPNIAEDLVRIFVQGDPISKYLIGKIAKETVWLGIVVIKSSKKESKVDFIKIKTKKRLDEKIEKIPNDFDKMALTYLDFRNNPKKF